MTKTSEEYLFETYMQEYCKHRDEMQNRINLQNGMAQRGINITVLAATLLATIFTFFMKDYGKPPTSSASYDNANLFVAVCLPVLFLHGVLVQLTLATWIYQLSMLFRILRYWNWIVVNKIEPIIGSSGDAFLWDLMPDPPWDLPLDKRWIKFFQPIFLYSLCAFSLTGFPISIFWDPPQVSLLFVRWFGLWLFPLLALGLIVLAMIHMNVQRATERSKRRAQPQPVSYQNNGGAQHVQFKESSSEEQSTQQEDTTDKG